ncbi:MAG: DUF4349 domain-containing protein, partial [Ignavibacteriales bacterium]|nr:DUF4349 domain-containing protein [Ignavibacteriales bacterium]
MNRLTTFLTLPAFFFVFASFGCTSDNEPRAVRVLNYADLGPPPSAAYSVGAFRSNDHASPSDLERPSPAPRMIIKTASISVEVADYERAVADIQKAVNERHGFTVTSTTQYSNRNSKSGNMRIRIPSSEFDATLESIMKVSLQVFSKTISGNDVTEEFFDVSARLRNKQMVELRFRETLRLAKSVKDILAVEESLG